MVNFFMMYIMISSTGTYALAQTVDTTAIESNDVNSSLTNQGDTNNSSSSLEGGIINKTLASPQRTTFAESSSPQPLTEEKKEQLEEAVEGTFAKPELEITNKTIEGPVVGTSIGSNDTSTSTNVTTSLNDSSINDIMSNNMSNMINRDVNSNFQQNTSMKSESGQDDISVYTNETITVPSTSISSILEPSVSNNGDIVFATANWVSARATDGGNSWKYLDPLKDFRAFCCDQLSIYDPSREIFVWYRQGISDQNGENLVKLSVSKDGLKWWTYNLEPIDLNQTWTNQWFDYANIALGNNSLYLTTNVFDENNEFLRSLIIRMSLDDLSNALPLTIDAYYDTSGDVFTFTPVQGAKDVMYWASHLTNSEMRVYTWPEDKPWTQINSADVVIPAWTPASMAGMSCPSPDGYDMCGRADSRITSGWLSGDTIGFFWNADQGGQSVHGATFNWPYINAATFNVTDMTYKDRPYLWSDSFAFLYGSASPNNNGDVGIEVVYGGGDRYPSLAAGIADSVSGNPPPWDLTTLMVGTSAPIRGEWGDYITVRSDSGSGDNWISVGFTLQGCGLDECIEPRYFTFGRQDNSTLS